MERKLPTINIKGTDFLVDVNNLRLLEKAAPTNYIQLHYMKEANNGYEFKYGVKSKNIPAIWTEEKSTKVKIPELVKLDPVGMSMKYNVPLEQLKGKTDFEVMVDQKAFDQRVNKGMLPTIDIGGVIFYVELEKDRLTPKADPLSIGIPISSFANPDHVLGNYIFAYDPLKKEIRELDYLTIKYIPEELIAINLPTAFRLDPIGWNKISERDLKFGLKTIELKMHFDVPKIPWEKTYLPDIIKENLASIKEKQERVKLLNYSIASQKNQEGKKGRKM